ncbi:MAG: CD225/dispanin family protein [Burkholderiales bacterium]|nr:CD225/dispanin family protein [Phycisphaerae bacterium]
MADQWYYAHGGQQLGPVTIAELRQKIVWGEIQPQALVWTEGMATWQAAHTVAGLATPAPQTTQSPQSPQPPGMPPAYAAPPGASPYQPLSYQGAAPPNYLVQSILVTICCCLPFGIVGIVYAAQVNSKFQGGDHAGAQLASANAKRWSMIGLICGIVINVLVFGLQIVVAVANS